MNTAEGTTKASGVKYPYTVQQFETLAEAVEAVEGGEDGILDIVNSQQDQSAKQNPKSDVRDAIEAAEEAGHSEDEIQEAVNAGEGATDALQAVVDAVRSAQESTAEFIIGRPRRTDGITKTAAREAGENLREKLGDEEFERLVQEHGIDVE